MRVGLRVSAVAWIGLLVGCTPAHDSKANDPGVSVSLRFRPKSAQRWREHWIYDIDAPGSGLVRTGLSLDVSVTQTDSNSFNVRHAVRRQYRARDGVAETMLWLGGSVFSVALGGDRAWLGELNVEARMPEAARLVREIVAAARFGMLIEYPDQAVSVGDSWSIEPQTLQVGPGFEAILRPSYTLQAIIKSGEDREVVIGADIQVDLVPEVLGDGVVVEGGGTASGSLRVHAHDGVLLEARSVLHFSQEVRVQSAEALGYREFSATAHVITTGVNGQADWSADPLKPEPSDAEEERACALQLTAAAQRVGRAALPLKQFVVGALAADSLPTTSAGSVVREPGPALLIGPDGKHLELDGVAIEAKDLARSLRSARVDGPLYVYAAASVPIERLRAVLAAVPAGSSTRLMMRTERADPPPRASRWLEEQLRLALTSELQSDRQARLKQLLVDHLVLCDGALDAFRKVESTHLGYTDLPQRIARAFAKCGCTTTNLEGLEATLHALFGSPDLRTVRVPPGLDRRLRGASGVAVVQDIVRVLAGPAP